MYCILVEVITVQNVNWLLIYTQRSLYSFLHFLVQASLNEKIVVSKTILQQVFVFFFCSKEVIFVRTYILVYLVYNIRPCLRFEHGCRRISILSGFHMSVVEFWFSFRQIFSGVLLGCRNIVLSYGEFHQFYEFWIIIYCLDGLKCVLNIFRWFNPNKEMIVSK